MAKKSAMEVILLENIPSLGKLGDIVAVKLGYARNFLIPQGKVKRATEENRQEFEKRRQELEQIQAEKLEEAQKLSGSLSGLTLQITQKAGVDGRLFGSVTVNDIHTALKDMSYVLEKRCILIAEPIKVIGNHEIQIKLHPEVSFSMTVSVLGES